MPSTRSRDTARSLILFPRTEPPGEARGVRLGAKLREEGQGLASPPEGEPPLGLCTAQGHADHRGLGRGRGHSVPPFKER